MTTELPSAEAISEQIRSTGIHKLNLRFPVGTVCEARGVYGLFIPRKGRIDVLDQARLSALKFDLNRALANFREDEKIQQPIVILEFNSELPDQEAPQSAGATGQQTGQQTGKLPATESDTQIWKASDSYALYEAHYESEKLLFRGMFGAHGVGVEKGDQKSIGKLKEALAAITANFSDSEWLRLDCVTVLFNPVEVKLPRLLMDSTATTQAELTEFQPAKPRYKWGAAKLSANVQAKLDDFIYEVENREELIEHRLYDVFPESAFLLALNGPAGTGKTTLASGVADRLGRPIIELSYATIENALVGEAAKTLKKVFEIARRTGAVLFIDEADSLASHRPASLSQGADYHISSLRSELFTEISKFDGVLVVATNNAHSYDKAFVSRIYLSIEMGLPNETLREQLWRRFLPQQVSKTADLPWEQIVEASEGLSGRDIANIAKPAAVRAHRRGNGAAVTFDDINQLIQQNKEDAAVHTQATVTPIIERIPVAPVEKTDERSVLKSVSKV